MFKARKSFPALLSFLLVAALFALGAPAAFAGEFCSAEFSYCDDNEAGDDPIENGSDRDRPRDGTKSYGGHYAECLGYFSNCQACVTDNRINTDVCAGVRFDASCECTETYRNYLIVNCQTFGSCDYYG